MESPHDPLSSLLLVTELQLPLVTSHPDDGNHTTLSPFAPATVSCILPNLSTSGAPQTITFSVPVSTNPALRTQLSSLNRRGKNLPTSVRSCSPTCPSGCE